MQSKSSVSRIQPKQLQDETKICLDREFFFVGCEITVVKKENSTRQEMMRKGRLKTHDRSSSQHKQ